MSTSNYKYQVVSADGDGQFALHCDGEPVLTPGGNLIKHTSRRLLNEIAKELESGWPGPDSHNDVVSVAALSAVGPGALQAAEKLISSGSLARLSR